MSRHRLLDRPAATDGDACGIHGLANDRCRNIDCWANRRHADGDTSGIRDLAAASAATPTAGPTGSHRRSTGPAGKNADSHTCGIHDFANGRCRDTDCWAGS